MARLSARLWKLFHVLKVIRRTVDETHDLAARAIEEKQLQTWKSMSTQELYALHVRAFDERARFAEQLETIRAALNNVDITPTPRTANLGIGARPSRRRRTTPRGPTLGKPT